MDFEKTEEEYTSEDLAIAQQILTSPQVAAATLQGEGPDWGNESYDIVTSRKNIVAFLKAALEGITTPLTEESLPHQMGMYEDNPEVVDLCNKIIAKVGIAPNSDFLGRLKAEWGLGDLTREEWLQEQVLFTPPVRKYIADLYYGLSKEAKTNDLPNQLRTTSKKMRKVAQGAPDLNAMLTFIPVSDPDGFEDYDKQVGYNACVYLLDGIVCSNDMAQGYRELVQQYEQRFPKEDPPI